MHAPGRKLSTAIKEWSTQDAVALELLQPPRVWSKVILVAAIQPGALGLKINV